MQNAISISSAENEPESSGESATGRISWEFRTPPGSTRTEIWLWPDNHKDEATRLGGDKEAAAFGVQFSQNDDWIVVSRHLSSGNLFSFYHQKPDGSYEEGQGGGADEPVPGFDSVQKIVPKTRSIGGLPISLDGIRDSVLAPLSFLGTLGSTRGPITFLGIVSAGPEYTICRNEQSSRHSRPVRWLLRPSWKNSIWTIIIVNCGTSWVQKLERFCSSRNTNG
jgi:hypothetical protein